MFDVFSQITCLAAISLCRIAIWIGLIGFILALGLAVRDGFSRLRRLHQIPCSHCAFFTGDYRLKCTVHPCSALSEDAIDCLDYEPLTRSQPQRSQINDSVVVLRITPMRRDSRLVKGLIRR
jgi:hypothetical protein